MTERMDGVAGIITGAGRGIGAAIARTLADLGARLVLADRDEATLAETIAAIAAAGGEVQPIAADVRDYRDMERLRDACLERFGRIGKTRTWRGRSPMS
jgi:3-oxoacyl-[acyl-carrier protein] reductase